jgi:hypothetical protein
LTTERANAGGVAKGRWREGLTAEDMPVENRLRHPKFIALRDDREAKEVVRED